MRTPDRLPDGALESLLDGSPSEDAVGTPLATYLDALRHDAVTTEYKPSAELSAVLAEGLDPAELEAGGILTATAGAASSSWRRRGRMALRAVTAKFAALGLLSKAAAAGAAVTVAASGAGVTGLLPEPAQSTFNEVIGREAPPESDTAEGDEGAETPPDTPADTSDTKPLDTDVPDDATGKSDGEPGVDGREVADDASDGRSGAAEDAPAEQPAGPEDTPAEERIEDTPARDEQAPATQRRTPGDPPGDVEQRPDEAPPSQGRETDD